MLLTMELPSLVLEEQVLDSNLSLPTIKSSWYQPTDFTLIHQEVEEALLQQETEEVKEVEEVNEIPTFFPHFNTEDVSQLSNLTPDHYYFLLEETGLRDVAWAFYLAEETYGVNGLFLVGLAALESGWGNSERSHRENNLTGYNIVSDSSSYSFETRADSLFATAKLIATDYLTEDGRYHLGTSVYSINLNYSSDEAWGEKIISIANKLLQQL